jgi:membrane protein
MGTTAAFQVLKRTVQDFGDDDAQTYAAAIAYYTVFSLPSLLPIILFAAGLTFGGAAVSGKIQSSLSRSAGPEVAGLLQRAVETATSSRGGVIATVLGAAGLMFSATTTFVNLQQALNRMWDVTVERSAAKGFAMKRLKCFLVIVGISVLILMSLIASTVISAAIKMVSLPIPNSLVYGIDVITSLILFTALFAILFKVLPDVQVEWRDVWAGAAFTSILFIVGKFLIAMYLTHSGAGNVYGAAGSLALLLLWTYYSANILLLGAEFVQAWSNHHGRQLRPVKGAVRTGRRGN